MYARCPRCHTVFAVTEIQLAQAGGRVRCGACMEPFDARAHRAEMEAPIPPAATAAPLESEHAQPEPDPVVPEPLAPESSAEHAAEWRAGHGTSTPAEPLTSAGPGDEPQELLIPESLIPDVRRGARRKTPPRTRLLRSLVVIALLLGVLLQLIWFYPQPVLQFLPIVKDPLQTWLLRHERLPVERRDLGRIRLASREVSAHPRFEGALVVRATLVNEAGFAQPYPRVRLTLYDVNGAMIARRTFAAQEYLGRTPLQATMPPDQAVPFEVELAAPETAAVSYEFDFL